MVGWYICILKSAASTRQETADFYFYQKGEFSLQFFYLFLRKTGSL